MFRTSSMGSKLVRVRLMTVLLGFLLLGLAGQLSAADWPQILGPNRDGVSLDTELNDDLGREDFEPVWSYPVGQGYAGASCSEGKAILFHRQGDEEWVESVRLANGQLVWRAKFKTEYRPRINPDSGPRCVPVIADGKVVVLGANGDLRCLDFESGEEVWSLSLKDSFRADDGYFGFGSTPIVVDNKVISVVGGRRGPALAAFQLTDGKKLWEAGSDEATYASPVLVELGNGGDEKRIVSVNRTRVYLVDPNNGEISQEFEFGIRSTSVCAALPIPIGNGLFFTASYGVGGKAMTWKGAQLDTNWENDSSLSSQYPTPVFADGYLYGTDGREDVGAAEFRCVEASTGKVAWSQSGIGMAHVLRVGESLVITTVEGELIIAEANPSGFRQRSRVRLFSGTARALPALSEGFLLVRSNAERGDGEFKCFRIGKPKS